MTHLPASARTCVNDIAARMTSEDVDQVMTVLRDAMRATKSQRVASGQAGRHNYEETPDHTTRLAAAGMLITATQRKPGSETPDAQTDRPSPEETRRRFVNDIGAFFAIASHFKSQPLDVTPRAGESAGG